MGYKNTFIKSVSWMVILQALTRLISLVKIVIIVRILTPFDLGLFGIVVLVVGLSEIFSEFGSQPFLIQYKKKIAEYADSVWVLQLIRGFLLFLIILIISLPVSLFFKQHQLLYLIMLGALNPLIKGFENIYVVDFQKELVFKKEFIYRFIFVITDFFVSVLIVFIFKSVIGLIIGMLIASFSGILYSWVFVKEKPRLKFNIIKIKTVLHYGKWMNLNSILYYLTTQLDAIVIGRILGASSLGFYQVAQKFSFTPMQEASDILGKVSFPVYSKISGDLERFRKAYIRLLSGSFIIELFILLILFIFAKEAILILLGSEWIVTESLFKTFLIYGFIASIMGTTGSLFLSVGRQDILAKLSFARVIILIPLIIWFVAIFGLQGAVYSLVLSLVLLAPLYFLLSFLLLKGKVSRGLSTK